LVGAHSDGNTAVSVAESVRHLACCRWGAAREGDPRVTSVYNLRSGESCGKRFANFRDHQAEVIVPGIPINSGLERYAFLAGDSLQILKFRVTDWVVGFRRRHFQHRRALVSCLAS
jgi:hypothetical protein